METEQIEELKTEHIELQSRYLKRSVEIDIYLPREDSMLCSLMLVNDGQDLVTMDFTNILNSVPLKPLIVAAIHCGSDRNNEYGMSVAPDFKGLGSKAGAYEKFVVNELIPVLKSRFQPITFTDISFAGFSLGALSALDICWNHPEIFNMAAVFSGSLWWRSVDKDNKEYNPWQHRMMHKQVADSEKRETMRFFFECGELDESEDRNKNGVIDSIDDTIDLMRVMVRKGYKEGRDFAYLQMPDGRHDVPSWARAWPRFLKWAYSE